MSEPRSDQSLLALWRKGDEQAARQLFERYAERLLALARKRISQRLAGRVDPEDITQSVFRTFFQRARAGQFRIEEQDDLYKLLVRITLHKTLRQVEVHKAAKRDPNLEVKQDSSSQEILAELLDNEPTPEAVNTFVDQLEHFVEQLRPQEREILELRMMGHSNEEIAKQLGTYDRKVRRVMERIRALAEQEGLQP